MRVAAGPAATRSHFTFLSFSVTLDTPSLLNCPADVAEG
jgi:hypothetical protein